MSESKVIEYSLRWPDTGEMYQVYDTHSEANRGLEDILEGYRNLGVPNRFAPVVRARVAKTETSDWMNVEDAQILFQADDHPRVVNEKMFIDQDTMARGTVLTEPEDVTHWQEARVKSGCLTFRDPCVVCGRIFEDCPHSVAETVALIKRIDPSRKIRR